MNTSSAFAAPADDLNPANSDHRMPWLVKLAQVLVAICTILAAMPIYVTLDMIAHGIGKPGLSAILIPTIFAIISACIFIANIKAMRIAKWGTIALLLYMTYTVTWVYIQQMAPPEARQQAEGGITSDEASRRGMTEITSAEFEFGRKVGIAFFLVLFGGTALGMLTSNQVRLFYNSPAKKDG